MTITIPENVRTIITAFESAGFEACAVGGCVRDAVLGREPQDWDIATSAKPEQTKELFRRTVDTGIKHGTVTVLIGDDSYEVTTYRVDGPYEDGRHPKEVSFTPCLSEDLARRDFTINAMAYSDTLGIVDLFGGMEDLNNRVIRCVGVPEERFGEDALRILRALRFSAQLGFEIDEATEKAAEKLAPTLQKISAERIREEMTKLLVSDQPEKIRRAYELGITAQFLPEFDEAMQTEQVSKYHCFGVGEHTIAVMKSVPATPVMRWAALLHDIGKPESCQTEADTGVTHFKGHGPVGAEMAKKILKRLKFDNATIDKVVKLVRWHWVFFRGDEYKVRSCLKDIDKELFEMLIELQLADSNGKKPEYIQEGIERTLSDKECFEKIIARGDCYKMDMLKVKGADLIAAGVKPGPGMGTIMNGMLDDVLHFPEHNDKTYLMETFVKSEK